MKNRVFLAILVTLLAASHLQAGVDLLVISVLDRNIIRYDGETGSLKGVFIPALTASPGWLTFGPDSNLYATIHSRDEVLRFNGITGEFMDILVGSGDGGLDGPADLVFGPDSNLYVVSNHNSNVLRYNGTTGAFINEFVPAYSGGLNCPVGLTFGPDSNLYVCSACTDEVLRYDGRTGDFDKPFVSAGAGGLDQPDGLMFGPDGNLYVCSAHTDEVLRYNGNTGEFIDVFVPTGSSGLDYPFGLTFGPDNMLYVAGNLSNNVVRSDGTTCEVFIAGVKEPTALVFFPELPLMVDIDIKPGSYPNAINLGSHGLVPVAILSDADFDATSVDPDTVELAGASVEVKVKGKSNKYMAHKEDVDGDGLVDLVVQVGTANLDPNTLQDGWAVLTAKTYEGQDIEGWDEITIVPPE